LADEFRTVLHRTGKTKPYILGKKVAILDCWGKARSWMHNDNWPQGHIPEFLSGFQADIEFINFDDIRQNGIGKDIGIIINWGCAGSAWSGGKHWADPKVVEEIREWVDQEGGFIGVEDPTAYEHQGRFFQLADVLGVEKEIGNRLAWAKNIHPEINRNHFILDDNVEDIEIGAVNSSVHLVSKDAELLAGTPDAVQMSTNTFGKGRAVYFADYIHNAINMRLLHRALLWVSGQERELTRWFSSDIHTDCAFYPEVEEFVVMNNSEQVRETTVYNANGKSVKLSLKPMEMKWFTLSEFNHLCK
jgi:1,3-beta-galactosyl-N-acetylhexosamine phosphorylase